MVVGSLLVGLLLVATACSSPSPEDQLADDLQEAGLWRNLTPEELDIARTEVQDGGHPWGTPIDERVLFFANGPALADGAVDEFLGELQPAVADLGVDYEVADASDTSVRIDDETVEWTDAETATMAPLAALNDRLAAAGADERFFVMNPGADDATVLLIDPEVVEVMADAGFDAPDETPVEATA